MASKRIAQSSINWAAMAERITPEQRASFNAFKLKSDSYLRRVLANPAEAPKIDWATYKKVVPVPGMVENFQKQYEALTIPYPADTLTAKVDAQWVEIKKQIEAFVKESNGSIASFEKQIADVKALLPYDQMTMEDFKDAYPQEALDPLNKPTYWPHTPEEQPGYVESADQPAPAH